MEDFTPPTLLWVPSSVQEPMDLCPKLKVTDKVAKRDFGKKGERRQG